jgi:hypothetical protein
VIISKKLGSSILVGTLLATPLGFPLENDTALAGSPETFDFSVAGGIALGTVLVEQKDLSSQKFQIGGVPLSVTWTNDSSQNWSYHYSIQALLDIVNRQVIRQGFTITSCYHLLGGARRTVDGGSSLRITRSNSHHFSMISRVAILNYSASDPKTPSQNLSGSLWEVGAGTEFRKDISDESAMGFSLLLGVTSFPASAARLSSRIHELSFFWRQIL